MGGLFVVQMGFYSGRQQDTERHGPHRGFHQGTEHMGQMGGLQHQSGHN